MRFPISAASATLTCNKAFRFSQLETVTLTVSTGSTIIDASLNLGAPMPVARFSTRPEGAYVLCTFDFTNIHDEASALAVVDESRQIVAAAAPKSLRILTDIANTYMSAPIVAALTDLVRHSEPYVDRSAMVGLALVHRIALRQIIRATGRDIREFKTRSEALAYLRAD